MVKTSSTLDLPFEAVLRNQFPFGHFKFVPLALEEVELHSRKNADYAGGGPPLGNFERRAAIAALYPKLDLSRPAIVALWDAFKQLDAAIWLLSNNQEGAVEGVADRLRDVSVYMKLAMILYQEEQDGTSEEASP